MKNLLLFLIFLCIKNDLHCSNSHSLLQQNSHTRSSSIQSINTPRSTEESSSFQTTPHVITIDQTNQSSRGYRSITIPETNDLNQDNHELNRNDYELLEKRITQCKLCGILSGGVGLLYILISTISK